MTTRATALFMILILLIAVLASGCTIHAADPVGESSPLAAMIFGGGMALLLASLGALIVNSYRAWVVLILVGVILILTGCAALPMPLQPANQQYNSNMAEGGFIVLAAVDTAQSMHIRKGTSCDHEADPIAAALYGSKYPKPGRVLITNLALITVHTMVTSWLDDKVAEHDQRNDGSVGAWYVGRVAWHGASLFLESAAVINNRSRGCTL